MVTGEVWYKGTDAPIGIDIEFEGVLLVLPPLQVVAISEDVVVHSSSSYIKMSHEPSYKLILPLTGVTGDAVDSAIGEFALELLALFEVKGIITDDGVGGGDRGNTDDEYNGCCCCW